MLVLDEIDILTRAKTAMSTSNKKHTQAKPKLHLAYLVISYSKHQALDLINHMSSPPNSLRESKAWPTHLCVAGLWCLPYFDIERQAAVPVKISKNPNDCHEQRKAT